MQGSPHVITDWVVRSTLKNSSWVFNGLNLWLCSLKWSLEDFSTMIQIWMKNGVKKTPLIKRFTTMPIIRAERKLNKTFTSQKRVKFHSPQECQKFLGLSVAKMQLSHYNFQVDNWAIFLNLQTKDTRF